MAPSVIQVRRVYDQAEPTDGVRVLVDRIWPRGLRKDAAALDLWAKEVAPSAELRTWYGHEPARFAEFQRRYLGELATPAGRDAVAELTAHAGAAPLTLLTATRDVPHSHATVLAQLLRDRS